jgi:hypothetical protein
VAIIADEMTRTAGKNAARSNAGLGEEGPQGKSLAQKEVERRQLLGLSACRLLEWGVVGVFGSG